MFVRSATKSDCSAIADLHISSWRLAYRDALSDEYLAGPVVSERQLHWQSRLTEEPENQHVMVAQHGDRLVGFACVYGNENAQWGSYLNNIHVCQTVQGLGIGTSLLHATAALCLRMYGEAGLYLWVLQANTKAQGFYARYGAQNTGTNVWQAPGGTSAPLFRFSWESCRFLQEMTANPSLNPDASSAALRVRRRGAS